MLVKLAFGSTTPTSKLSGGNNYIGRRNKQKLLLVVDKITFSMRRLLVTRITSVILLEIDAGPSISTTPFRPAHATATTCKPRRTKRAR